MKYDFLDNKKTLKLVIFHINIILFTFTFGPEPFGLVLKYLLDNHVLIPDSVIIFGMVISYPVFGVASYFISRKILARFPEKTQMKILLFSLVILVSHWVFRDLFSTGLQEIR